MMPEALEFIHADWPAPDHVHALTTTRKGGVSEAEYASLNLADHVEDKPEHVRTNRELLCRQLGIHQPVWLKQVHGIHVVDSQQAENPIEADAVFTSKTNDACSVLTADCLPLLFCNRQGSKVAAAHAGWRGLANGVIETTIDALHENNRDLMVWFGPAIGPEVFEVGQDVVDAFVSHDPGSINAFTQTDETHYLADIYQLARQRLKKMGIEQVYGGGLCTYSDKERFYSFRRNAKTGRMASMIWMSEE